MKVVGECIKQELCKIPETVLSSALLMNPLSKDAKVIAPCVGSFIDYSKEDRLKVFTFNLFVEIESIVKKYGLEEIDIRGYKLFLWKIRGQILEYNSSTC